MQSLARKIFKEINHHFHLKLTYQTLAPSSSIKRQLFFKYPLINTRLTFHLTLVKFKLIIIILKCVANCQKGVDNIILFPANMCIISFAMSKQIAHPRAPLAQIHCSSHTQFPRCRLYYYRCYTNIIKKICMK